MPIASGRFTAFALAAFAVAGAGEVEAAPASVGLFGDLQSEIGCGADFQGGCAQSALVFDAIDAVWQRVLSVPASMPNPAWQYSAILDGDVGQLVGRNGIPNGLNPVQLSLPASRSVKFYFDATTSWLTDNVNSVIVTLAGDFQSELGCSGDFQPDCLRSWLQDVDGDGIYERRITGLPTGTYSFVIAHGESFDEAYGNGGLTSVLGGNVVFDVASLTTETWFLYDPLTHLITIRSSDVVDPPPSAVGAPGSLLLLGTGLAALRRRRHA